jgi:hypothetical protein
MKENHPQNIFTAHAMSPKDKAYRIAYSYWENKDQEKAEEWAIKAMKLGSRNLAPELLAKMAESTRSKSTAVTLASYYKDQKEFEIALKWARTAKEYGSINLADKLISEITAYQNAVEIHHEVGQFSN